MSFCVGTRPIGYVNYSENTVSSKVVHSQLNDGQLGLEGGLIDSKTVILRLFQEKKAVSAVTFELPQEPVCFLVYAERSQTSSFTLRIEKCKALRAAIK